MSDDFPYTQPIRECAVYMHPYVPTWTTEGDPCNDKWQGVTCNYDYAAIIPILV